MIIIDEVEIHAAMDRGNLWCMIRTADKATFEAQAFAVGLMVHETPEVPEVLDPETGEVVTAAIPASGPLVPASGVTITEIGEVMRTPAILHPTTGVVVTPAIVDKRFHANFWLDAETVSRGLWVSWAAAWTAQGAAVVPNSGERGKALRGIELLDPETVKDPRNVLL